MSAPTMAPPQAGAPQLMPYGILGDLARAIGPSAGGAIGSWLGNEQLGRQLGGYAGQLAQRYSPYSAGPPTPDQGSTVPPELVQALAALPPQVLVQLVQQVQQVQQLQQAAAQGQPGQPGQVQGQPQGQPQIAPYGFFGDLVGQIAPQVGQYFGGSTGQQIGNVAGQLASRYLPFSAGPQLPQGPQGPQGQGQLAPYGFFGDLVGQIAPGVGEYLGGSTGRTIGDVAGHLASYLPFSAGPQLPQQPQQPQLAPYGVFGGALGNYLGGHAGNAVGGWLGNSGLGQTIGSGLGTALGAMLPFSAGPQQPQPQLYGQR